MGEVQAADAGRRVHREAFGELDAGRSLGIEQLEERALLGVIGLGRIAGRRADAAVFFVDQLFVRELLARAIAPVAAGLRVQLLGERLGQPVGERLGHDRVVIVVLAVELARPARRSRCRP